MGYLILMFILREKNPPSPLIILLMWSSLLERFSSELFLVCFVWCAVTDIFPRVSAALAKVLFIIPTIFKHGREMPPLFFMALIGITFFHGSFRLLSYLFAFSTKAAVFQLGVVKLSPSLKILFFELVVVYLFFKLQHSPVGILQHEI